MANLLGGITLANTFSMEKLPQRAASAWAAFDGTEFTGASYKPLLYAGCQVTKGTTYWFIAEQTVIYQDAVRHIVKLAINEFTKNVDGEIETVYRLVPNSIEIIF